MTATGWTRDTAAARVPPRDGPVTAAFPDAARFR